MAELIELTRRDALVAVAAATAGVTGAGEIADRLDSATTPRANLDRVLDGLLAATEVVYPTPVTVDDAFLETFILGRTLDEEQFLAACERALAELDRATRERFSSRFEAVPPARRERVLLDMGVPAATPEPDGTELERVRYYVVNELLYALYTSPTGGRLLGNENPPGYPGGTDAYQRGPTDG